MSLIAWYKLDGNALDSSGNRRDGSTVGTPNVVAGKIGSAYSFNYSSSDGISIPNNKFPLYDFTMTAWIKPVGNHYHYDGTIISSGDWNSSHWSFGINQSNTGFSCRNPYVTWAYAFTLNTWHFVVYRREGTNLKLYANNTLLHDGTVTSHIPLSSGATNTCIGRETYANGYFGFNGSIDDVRIYDHALSEKEIRELAKAKILHYTFDKFQEPTENLIPYSTLSAFTSTKTTPKGEVSGWEITGIANDNPRVQLTTGSIPVSPSTVYTFSAIYWHSQNIVDDVYINFNVTGYPESGAYLQPFTSQTASLGGYYSIKDLGNGWKYCSGTFTTTANTTAINTIFFDSDTAGYVCFIGNIQLEKKDHATPFVNGTRTGSVSDNSGYGNNADLALATTPQWTEDSRIGKGAYKFNGTTSGIERIGNFSDIKTISMWVNRQSIPTDARVLLVHSPTEVGLGFFNNGYLILSSSGTTQRQRTAIISGFKNNSWNHIAVTYSNTKVPTCYINGVETTYSDTNYWTAPETTLYIGRRTSGSVFDGQIDDVRIYATALSADDIKELYNTRAQIDNKGNFFVNNINQTGHKPLLLDYTTWQNGQVGAIGQFGINGSSEESVRVITDDPWGKASVVWETRPDAANDADGGWNSSYVTVDNTKDYRFVVWVRRPTNETGGTFYLGLNSSIIRNDTGAVESNPYFSYIGQSELSVGVWYLVVGHCFNKDYTGGIHPDSGWYTVIDGKIATKSYGNIGTSDCRFQTAQIGILHRTYHFYSTNVLARLQFAYPRIDVCDGTEPSIAELLSGFDSTYIDFIREKGGTATLPLNVGDRLTYVGEISEIGPANGLVAYYPLNGNAKDYVNANDGTVYGAVPAAGINGKACYSFDGEDDYIQIGSPITGIWDSPFTFSVWAKATSGSGRGVLLGDYSMTNALNVNIEWNSPNLRLYWAGSPDIQASLSLAYDTWNFLTIVRDKSSSQVRFYKDGVLGYTYSGNLADKTATTNLHRIGSDGRTGEPVFNGSIQNVRIYNRALSQEEISILYDLEKGDTVKVKMDKNTLYLGGQIYEG